MRAAVLFVPFFTPKNDARSSELLHALKKNLRLKWLDKVVLMVDDDTFSRTPPPGGNIIIKRFSRRPQYADWIRLSALYATGKHLSICANADIELLPDFFLLASNELRRPKTLLCITRYELEAAKDPTLRENPHWTQDTWCLRGDDAAEIKDSFIQDLNIPFGVPRCDNRLPYVFWLRNWNINNPCRRIVTLHHHRGASRSYSKKDTTILGGVLFVHPSKVASKPSSLELNIFSNNNSDPLLIAHNKFLVPAEQTNDIEEPKSDEKMIHSCAHHGLMLTNKQYFLLKEILTNNWSEVHRYSQQFRVYKKDSRLAFVDTEWPSVLVYSDPGFENLTPQERRDCFFWGFCSPVTDFLPNHFSPKKLFPNQRNFWQYPCKTEQDAYERHLKIEAPVFCESVAHTYIGLPWATWIDKKGFPNELIEVFGKRISSVRHLLGKWNIKLEVHSVCQHIRWRESVRIIERVGVNQLWICHKEKGWDREGQLQLHSWPLYPVNILDPERKMGLEILPVEQKTIFASFKGAHMKHYISDIRLRLKELARLDGYVIEVNDLWHFNKMIYDYQATNKEVCKNEAERESVTTYNQLLSKSLFSLCPAGAGPNTLRLWESLGAGSIPVVISDLYEPPQPFCESKSNPLNLTWKDACISIKEKDLHSLPQLLASIPCSRLVKIRETALRLFDCSLLLTCFSEQKSKTCENISLLGKPQQEHQSLLGSFKKPQRIAVLGSSLSIQRKGYLPRLIERLNELIDNPQSRHCVLNASLGGTNVYATLSYASSGLFYQLKDFSPTVAIIEKSPNNRICGFASLDAESKSAEISSTIASTRRLIRYLRSIGCETVICVTSFIEDSDMINWDGDCADSSYLAFIDKKASEQENAFHINAASALSAGYDRRICDILLDNVHVNEDGAMAYCEAMIISMSRRLIGEARSSLIPPVNLATDAVADQYPRIVLPIGPVQKEWQSSILSVRYTEIKSQIAIRLPDDLPRGSCIAGLFFIADPMSPIIRIDSDSDDPFRICLFDHYCYMQRVHFRLTRQIRVDREFVVSFESQDVDYEVAVNQFNQSKTFDPGSEWARIKYLEPLLAAKNGRQKMLKLIGFVCDYVHLPNIER